MNCESFRNISIRGRVAFSINCFEKVLIMLNCNVDSWRTVLEDMWSFTSIEFLDDWGALMAEILPDCILEFNDFNDDYEYIGKEKFHCLQSLYKNIDIRLKTIMRYIFNIGECHAYSVIINNGIESLNNVGELIEYMIKNAIPLPNVDKYLRFTISEDNGWGSRFNGREFSIILK